MTKVRSSRWSTPDPEPVGVVSGHFHAWPRVFDVGRPRRARRLLSVAPRQLWRAPRTVGCAPGSPPRDGVLLRPLPRPVLIPPPAWMRAGAHPRVHPFPDFLGAQLAGPVRSPA